MATKAEARPLEGQKNPTTREYYEKYRKLCAERGVTIEAEHLGKTPEELANCYRKDRNLNTIPLLVWDGMACWLRGSSLAEGISLAEGVCMLKHAAIYHALGMVPDFKTVRELFNRG